jgi:hypothetical protein
LSNFVLPLLFFIPLLALLSCRSPALRLVRLVGIASLILGCFLNNPIVVARFYFGALAIGTVLLLFGPKRAGLALFVTGAGTLAAPLLNVFRDTWAWEHTETELGISALSTFDFDAFTSVCYGLLFYGRYGIMYGTNILGSMLFFVPSSMWTSKPEYTGGLLYKAVVSHYHMAGQAPDNLSAPVPIEGYLAFGWPGAVALSLVFGMLVRWLDGAQCDSGLRSRSLSARVLCLAFSPALLMFIARGSLMPTFAYTVGMFSAISVAVYLLRAPNRPLDLSSTLAIPGRHGGDVVHGMVEAAEPPAERHHRLDR